MNIHLALGSDLNMEVGLHVTLYTALKFLRSDCSATIHLFLKNFSSKAIQRLHQTLLPYQGRYQLEIYDTKALALGNGKALHGSKMPYVSLIAPDLIEAERLLFLDADLLVLMDLAEVFLQELNQKTAGVVFQRPISQSWSTELEVFQSIGVPEDIPYFSSGVVLFNARQWKDKKLTVTCFQIIEQYGDKLRNTDQTVLNAALCGDIAPLPENCHRIFYTAGIPIEEDVSRCICHLGGSPKPWDFLGEYLNNSYPVFQQYLKETAFANYKSYLALSPGKIKRTVRLSRSYSQVIQHRINRYFDRLKPELGSLKDL